MMKLVFYILLITFIRWNYLYFLDFIRYCFKLSDILMNFSQFFNSRWYDGMILQVFAIFNLALLNINQKFTQIISFMNKNMSLKILNSLIHTFHRLSRYLSL